MFSRGTEEKKGYEHEFRIQGRRKGEYNELGPSFILHRPVLAVVEPAWGQQVTAVITGKVTDPKGTAMVGVKVVAMDIARGTVWTTETNSEGFYNLPRIPVEL